MMENASSKESQKSFISLDYGTHLIFCECIKDRFIRKRRVDNRMFLLKVEQWEANLLGKSFLGCWRVFSRRSLWLWEALISIFFDSGRYLMLFLVIRFWKRSQKIWFMSAAKKISGTKWMDWSFDWEGKRFSNFVQIGVFMITSQ